MTFSRRFGFMDMQEDDGTFDQIKRSLRSGAWVGQVPWVYWINERIRPIIGNYLGLNARHGRLREFAVHEVQNRKQRGSDRRDILGELFAVQEEKPKVMGEYEITSMAASNIFAGSDTTAIALRSIIYFLLKNEDCKRKLIGEVDAQCGDGIPTLDLTTKMPYLQAVIYESLRCHTPPGMNLPRATPPGGMEIQGFFIPEGVCYTHNSQLVVSFTNSFVTDYRRVNPWVIHRNQKVFGHDAEVFNPERWQTAETGMMSMNSQRASAIYKLKFRQKNTFFPSEV